MRCKKPRRSARREGPNEQVFTYEVSCSRTRVASSLRNGVGVRTSGERDANRRHERQEQHRRASRRRAAAVRAGPRLGAAACGAAPCGARCERANGSVSAPSSHYPAQQPLLARRRGGAAASEPAALESVPPNDSRAGGASHAPPCGDTLPKAARRHAASDAPCIAAEGARGRARRGRRCARRRASVLLGSVSAPHGPRRGGPTPPRGAGVALGRRAGRTLPFPGRGPERGAKAAEQHGAGGTV